MTREGDARLASHIVPYAFYILPQDFEWSKGHLSVHVGEGQYVTLPDMCDSGL